MGSMSDQRVPTTVVAGFLGAGKTTTIRALAAQRPESARWVVLVNEFGELGIDGAILSDGALMVAELPGGCLCCSADAPFRVTLANTLEQLRPDHLIIEPTGMAQLGTLLDTLDGEFADRIVRRATLTVVDPRQFVDPAFANRRNYASQVQAADVLIANRCDVVDDATLREFLQLAADLYPPKLALITTTQGEIDPALLHRDPRPGIPRAHLGHHHLHDHTARIATRVADRLLRRQVSGPDFTTAGWQIPPAHVLPMAGLAALLDALRRHGPLIPGGAMRLKGVLHTDRGWRVVQADGDGIRWSETAWRTDSRLELIAAPDLDLPGIEAALLLLV
ncbi:MAG: G3E family GTPase [Myxococcota bacterium]|jgi:G3E family GTPase